MENFCIIFCYTNFRKTLPTPSDTLPAAVDINHFLISLCLSPSAHFNTQILNNQAYDANLYSGFIPQDAVQQYVSQYSGNGFAGQALEGFLIPTIKQEPIPVSPTSVALMKTFLPGPKLIIALLTKLIAVAATAAGILLFGGAITSFVCAFTPLCTITFFGRPLDLLRKETKDIVEKIGNEITTDRIKRAAGLLKLAVERYENYQK